MRVKRMQIFLFLFTDVYKSWWEIYWFPVCIDDSKVLFYIVFIGGKILVLNEKTILSEHFCCGRKYFAGMDWIHTSEWECRDNYLSASFWKSFQTSLSVHVKYFCMMIVIFFEIFISIFLYLARSKYCFIHFPFKDCSRSHSGSSSELHDAWNSLPINIFEHTIDKKTGWWKSIADILPKKYPLLIEWIWKKFSDSSPKSEPMMSKFSETNEPPSWDLWFRHSLFVRVKIFYQTFSQYLRQFLH